MIKNLFLVLILIIIMGCMTNPVKTTAVSENPVKILALGDSYTIGQGVDSSERWPFLLAEELRKEKIKTDEPVIIAQTGWTSGELLAEVENVRHKGKYSFVFILIGVNNQFRGLSSEEYRAEFNKIQDKALEFSYNKPENVFVISISDWSAAPFAEDMDREKISAEIDFFNKINEEEAKKKGFKYINITPVSRKALNDRTLIADDGLHPSAKMYREWVSLIKPEVIEVLKN